MVQNSENCWEKHKVTAELQAATTVWLLESLTLLLLVHKELTEAAVVEAMAAGDATATHTHTQL